MRRTAALVLVTFASLALPGVAHALGVRLSIRGAGTVHETTVFNQIAVRCGAPVLESPATTPTNIFGAQCVAGSATGGYPSGSIVEYVATPAPGYRFNRWQPDGGQGTAVTCGLSSPPATSTTYPGSSTCRFVITDNLQTQVTFVDDTDPVMATLVGPTSAVSGPASFTFSAATDPTLKAYECRVPGFRDTWAACISGVEEDPPDGTWTFEIRAVDFSNNRSPVSSWQWEVDTEEPDTSLTGGPSGPTATSDAAFAFESTEEGDFLCRLDGGEQAVCESGVAYSGLPDGEHSFEVWARDAAGHVDPTPAVGTWTIDTLAPETSLTGGPSGTVASAAVTFTFESSESGDFLCRLEGGPQETCASGVAYSGLPDGEYSFEVWARDSLGHVDPTPAVRTWTVDTVAPQTLVLIAPPATTTASAATVEFGSTEPAGSFRCQLDLGDPAPCSSPHTVDGLALGTHTLKVWASDAVGNEDATPAEIEWTVNAPPAADPDPPTDPAPDPPADPAPPSDTLPAPALPPSGSPTPAPPAPAATPSAPPARSTGPTRSLSGVHAIALGAGTLRLSKGAIPLRVSCPTGQACSGSVAVTATKPRLALGRTTYRLVAGKRATLRVKLSSKGLKLLRKTGRLKVRVAAAGRSWTRTLRL